MSGFISCEWFLIAWGVDTHTHTHTRTHTHANTHSDFPDKKKPGAPAKGQHMPGLKVMANQMQHCKWLDL